MNDRSSNLDNKMTVKILYVDFVKAFDVVSIPKLIIKLEHYGICGLYYHVLLHFLVTVL